MTSPCEKCDGELQIRRSAPIWSLPAELLLHLLKGLQINDLLNLRSVKSLSVSSYGDTKVGGENIVLFAIRLVKSNGIHCTKQL